MFRILFFLLLSLNTPLLARRTAKKPNRRAISKFSHVQTQTKEYALLQTLDPLSAGDHLAFYKLYPETPEGEKALQKAWSLLQKDINNTGSIALPSAQLEQIMSLISPERRGEPPELTEKQIEAVELIGSRLANRKLEGYHVWTLPSLISLPVSQVDLSRGLLIQQFSKDENPELSIRRYEALLDLMALQISARLSDNASPEEKITEISKFIFHEQGFRFPPHSVHAKNIDEYTFLPSVLDGRKGVCLGVSILYLSIAQRLDLPLEIITPPGHIYVRYNDNGNHINIETTARGLHIPSESYLGVGTRKLEVRNIKEVIGMALFNEASVRWREGEYLKTADLYEKALIFMPGDPLVKMLLGCAYAITGEKAKAKSLFKEISGKPFDFAVSPESIPEDYLAGNVGPSAIKAVFMPVDSTRDSIHKKQEELTKILRHYPKFRMGHLHLATTYLQLGRTKEAAQSLERYHKLDPNDATVEYYISQLALSHSDYNKAWIHLQNAEKISESRDHAPYALRNTRHHLRTLCPLPPN